MLLRLLIVLVFGAACVGAAAAQRVRVTVLVEATAADYAGVVAAYDK